MRLYILPPLSASSRFFFAVSSKFLENFGTKPVFLSHFCFNPFPFVVFNTIFRNSGIVGEGYGNQPISSLVRGKTKTITRSRILTTLEHLKVTLPNCYFKKLPGGEITFLVPPITLKHYTVHGTPKEHVRIYYSVGFLNSYGVFTFPDKFFQFQTQDFFTFVTCIIPIASEWQPQNRERILGQRSVFIKLKQELAKAASEPRERPR